MRRNKIRAKGILLALAVAVVNSANSGNHLGVTWHDSGRRSSFVGAFAE